MLIFHFMQKSFEDNEIECVGLCVCVCVERDKEEDEAQEKIP